MGGVGGKIPPLYVLLFAVYNRDKVLLSVLANNIRDKLLLSVLARKV